MARALGNSPQRERARLSWLAFLMAFALLFMGAPAFAHKDHKKEQAQAGQVVGNSTAHDMAMPMNGTMADGHDANGGMMDGMDMDMDRSKLPFFERLLEWIGRLHPLIVHFPIAFFPAALITAIVGRKRPSFGAPVQFLVIAGGLLAPVAAAAGWLSGMSSDPEPILTYHRWLGVAIGLAGAGLGVWAWRRPWEDRGAGMILALSAITAAIAVQGFLGAALTHGLDHLMF